MVTMKVSVICADPLMSEGLASLLKHSGGFSVVARESRMDRGLAFASKHGIEYVVMTQDALEAEDDPMLPRPHGFMGIKAILLGTDDKGFPFHATIDPSLGSSELFAALRKLVGEEYVEPVGAAVPHPSDSANHGVSLSPREKDVARLVARGLSNRNIAEILGVQEQSIKNTVSGLMTKLGCENRVQVLLKVQNMEVANR